MAVGAAVGDVGADVWLGQLTSLANGLVSSHAASGTATLLGLQGLQAVLELPERAGLCSGLVGFGSNGGSWELALISDS